MVANKQRYDSDTIESLITETILDDVKEEYLYPPSLG